MLILSLSLYIFPIRLNVFFFPFLSCVQALVGLFLIICIASFGIEYNLASYNHNCVTYDVMHYGAAGDGRRDDSQVNSLIMIFYTCIYTYMCIYLCNSFLNQHMYDKGARKPGFQLCWPDHFYRNFFVGKKKFFN